MLSTFLDGGDDCRFSGLVLRDFCAQSRTVPHSHKFAEPTQLPCSRWPICLFFRTKKAPTFVGAYCGTLNQCEVLGDMSGFLASDGELAMILHCLVLMPALLLGLIDALAPGTRNPLRANAHLKHFLRS